MAGRREGLDITPEEGDARHCGRKMGYGRPLRLANEPSQGVAVDAEADDAGAVRNAGVLRKCIGEEEAVAGLDPYGPAGLADGLPTAREEADREIFIAVVEVAPRAHVAAGRTFEQ